MYIPEGILFVLLVILAVELVKDLIIMYIPEIILFVLLVTLAVEFVKEIMK